MTETGFRPITKQSFWVACHGCEWRVRVETLSQTAAVAQIGQHAFNHMSQRPSHTVAVASTNDNE